MTLLRTLAVVAVAAWLGIIAFFSFEVAPVVFKTIDRAIAGQAVTAVLPRYYRWGLALSGVALVASASGLLALWLVPDLLAAGDPLRSSERARMPSPGAPALDARPVLEPLQRALAIPPLPIPTRSAPPSGARSAAPSATAWVAWCPPAATP